MCRAFLLPSPSSCKVVVQREWCREGGAHALEQSQRDGGLFLVRHSFSLSFGLSRAHLHSCHSHEGIPMPCVLSGTHTHTRYPSGTILSSPGRRLAKKRARPGGWIVCRRRPGVPSLLAWRAGMPNKGMTLDCQRTTPPPPPSTPQPARHTGRGWLAPVRGPSSGAGWACRRDTVPCLVDLDPEKKKRKESKGREGAWHARNASRHMTSPASPWLCAVRAVHA